jgi:hypothetical protein
LLEVLCHELGLKGIDDQLTFATSYGGELKGDQVSFSLGAAGKAPPSATCRTRSREKRSSMLTWMFRFDPSRA